MEEQTSWKNHGFTLLIFGGIVTLSAIFFILGMLVGRTQGQQMAKQALEEAAEEEDVSQTSAGDFPINLHAETAGEKPGLQPPTARKDSGPTLSAAPRDSGGKASPKPAETKAKSPGAFVQVFATRNEKKALEELKRVRSKGFKANVVEAMSGNEKVHRVVVGPYKESEINLAKSDLRAQGYKDLMIR